MSCCDNSQSVVLFPDGDRNEGTEEVIFDTKQSEKIYYFVDFKIITPTTTVVATIESGGDILNLSNSVDKDISTFATYQTPSSTTGTTILRFDWGTQALRTIRGIFGAGSGTGDELRVDVRWAGSDLVFSSFVDLFDLIGDTGFSNTIFDMPFGQQDLRYVEMELDTIISVGTSPVVNINEMFDREEGLGSSNVNIQVKNNITGNWFTVDTLSFIDGLSNVEVLDTKTAIQPNNSLTRIQLVNDGKWNGSVGAILVNPKFG